MSWGHPWLLALLALPAGWVLWEWRNSHRRAGLLLKVAAFALILLALAEPRLTISESRVALALLADASPSIGEQGLAAERAWIERIAAARGGSAVHVLSFGESVRRGALPANGAPELGRGTDLEAAIHAGLAVLPADRIPRLALLSDGHPTSGSLERGLYQVRQRGVPIDVFPIEGRPEPQLRMTTLDAPRRAYVGERITVEAVVESPGPATALVELQAEGRNLGRSRLALQPGANTVRLLASLDAEGSALIEGRVATAEFGELRFAWPLALQRPRVLLISSDAAEQERHFNSVLAQAGFKVERSPGVLSGFPLVPQSRGPSSHPLARFDVIIANNEDFEKWPREHKESIEAFVNDGGGFLLIGGENNLYVERPAGDDDPLRAMLPAELAPPRAPEGAAVVLALDKSSSMEGKKMQLARQSALGVVDNLRPIDTVGVLAFDNSFQWAVPLQRNENPREIKNQINSIIADGGTQIAPALHEAFRQIRPREAIYKHILLLTDGISEEGDSIALAREAANLDITISTIGLGQDVNRSYLERVAENANGKAYFVIEVEQLAQVVLRDVMEHTGSSVMEREFRPEVVREVELLEGIDFPRAGPLKGWVRFIPKQQAETILRVSGEDPLLVRWQYGLGRSAVFASDAKERWAAEWIEWEGFDRFWANVIRDLLPRTPATAVRARYDEAAGVLVVRYEMGARVPEPAPGELARLFVHGPGGFQKAVQAERVAARTYEARSPLEDLYGLFRIRPREELSAFPEAAFYRENKELATYGTDEGLLRRVAEASGGRFAPQPAELFDASGRAQPSRLNLWPGLLALAGLLNLLEVLARKGWLPWLGRWA